MSEPGTAPHVRFRPWRRSDRERGLTLFDSNVPEFFAATERADFTALIDALPGPYFAVLDGSRAMVGCGGYAADPERPGVAALCWGMIHRAHHRRGFGEALLRYRLEAIRADPAFVLVEIETTPFSRGFFLRHGFVECGHVPDGFAPGFDLVRMRLDIERRRRSVHAP